MAGAKWYTLVLAMVLATGPMAGCLGSEGVDILPERKGVPGGLALACLRDGGFTSMVIEIDHAPGYRPYSSSTDLLIERMESVCEKPSGITLKFNEVNLTMKVIGRPKMFGTKVGNTKTLHRPTEPPFAGKFSFLRARMQKRMFWELPLMPRPWRCSVIPSRRPTDCSAGRRLRMWRTASSSTRQVICSGW